MSRSTSPGTWRTRAGSVAALTVATAATVLVVAPGSGSISGAADPTLTPIPLADSVESGPLISDDGSIVALGSSIPADPAAVDPGATDEPLVVARVHDRTTGVTVDLPDVGARFTALSGDGCTVAYAVPVPVDPVVPPPDPAGPTTTIEPDDSNEPSVPDPGQSTTTVAPGTPPGSAAGPATTVGDPADDNEPAPPPAPGDNQNPPVPADPGGANDPAPAPPEGDTVTEPSAPQRFEVRVVDRCDVDGAGLAGPTSVLVSTSPVVAPLALDRAGLTLVVNTGEHIARFTRAPADDEVPATPFAETERFDLQPVADAASVTTGPIDVSDDGTTVVFEAGPTPPDPDTPPSSPTGVNVWEAGVVTPLVGDATAPSISGDGRLVAVVVRDVEAPDGAGLHVVDRGPDGATPVPRPIDPAGVSPTMSADGTQLLYVVADGETPGLRRAAWSGDGTDAFGSVTVTDLGVPPEGDLRLAVPTTPAAISRSGDVLASDDPVSGDVLVRTVPPAAAFDADEYDLGSADVGDTLTGSAVLRNTGGSTIDLDLATIEVGSPFVLLDPVGDVGCVGSLRPDATCTVGVEYAVEAPIDVVADLTLTVPGSDTPIATTQVVAVGAVPPTTTAGTQPTVTVPGTTPGTVPTRPPTQTPSRPTVTTTTTTTTTTTVPPSPTFSPNSFEFAPTIVNAGRRAASLAVANPATTGIEVVAVVVEPADAGFSIDEGSGCAGSSVPAGSTCLVDVVFAPTVEGAASAVLVATFADGREARASVSGVGAPPPVVDIVPGVASTGQVVTIRGSGYPAGAAVDVVVGADPVSRVVTVGDAGAFDLPIVVMPNTTPGPLVISVPGQTDLFPTVASTLLVTVTGDRTSPAVLRGPGVNIGR